MTVPAGFQVTAAVQAQRGTAATCACGGALEGHCEPVDVTGSDAIVRKVPGRVTWACRDCGKEYAG